jgi:hypothetical protein
LPRIAVPTLLRQHAAGKPQLQSLHRDRQSVFVGFAEEQMHMLGHHHKTKHHEAITPTHLFEHAKKQVPPPRRAQSRLPMVTAEGEEMQIAAAVIAPEASWHGNRLIPANHLFCDRHTTER